MSVLNSNVHTQIYTHTHTYCTRFYTLGYKSPVIYIYYVTENIFKYKYIYINTKITKNYRKYIISKYS